MGPLAVAFSARSTGESAWLLLGLTGFGAAFGAQGFWIVLGELLGVSLSWAFLARRFKNLTARYDSITVPDYLESRFRDQGKGLRLLAAGSLLVFVPIYVSAQIHATGEAFSAFLDWNYYAGALFGFLVVLLYVTRGGFISVVWSDVFQAIMMVVGLVALPLVGIVVAGGLEPILSYLQANYPTHLSMTGGQEWNLLTVAGILGLLGIGLGYLGSPQVYVRLISLRSDDVIPAARAIAIIWTLLADCGAVMVGMVGRVLLDGDLGIHGKIDGGPWKRVEIEGPDGPNERSLLKVRATGKLRRQGMTELFFESEEPTFDELPPSKFFKRFAEGEYEIEGESLDGEELESEVVLSHIMPAAPREITLNDVPAAEDCDADELPVVTPPVVLSWNAEQVSHPELGRDGPVVVRYYEVVVEIDESDYKSTAIIPRVEVGGRVSWQIPDDFFRVTAEEADGEYKFEILTRTNVHDSEDQLVMMEVEVENEDGNDVIVLVPVPGNKSASESCFELAEN